VEPRQDVEVRSRFDGRWVGGFQVSETTDVGGEERYRLTRLSDGVVLPELFDAREVRRRAARDRVLPMARRRATAPAGAGGS
jgi:hypothetical protein